MIEKSKRELILASGSPRRFRLLKEAGLKFSVIPSDFDESSTPLKEPSLYVKELAKAKAYNVGAAHPFKWIIGADTIVLLNHRVLGKPGSLDSARDMLEKLSGKSHKVLTGYCILCLGEKLEFLDTVITEVIFKKLSREEIDWYVSRDMPLDKAGAYAVQGKGAFMVKSIYGSYTNVVGLPICEVVSFFTKQGVIQDFKI